MSNNLVYHYNNVAIGSCGIVIFVQLLLLLSLFIKLWTQNVLIQIKVLTFSTYLNLIIAYSMLLASRASYLANPESDEWLTFWILYLSFGGITTVGLYIFLLLRLYRTYKDTSFEMKPVHIRIHLVIALIALMGMISVALVGQIEDSHGLWFINLVVSALMVGFGSCHLIYLFNRHLFTQLLAHRAKLKQSGKAGHEAHMSVELQVIQLDLLGTIRKHSFLGCVMVLSLFIALLTPMISIFIEEGDGKGIFWICWYPLHSIFINICGLSMYLGFAVNSIEYLHCCGKCDRGCESLCITLAKRKIKQSVPEPSTVKQISV